MSVIALPLVSGVGCYYDVEENLFIAPCDTTNVTYQAVIKPILERECYDCHSGFSPDGELDLSIYNSVLASALSEDNKGSLHYRITRDTTDLPRMPYLLPKMDNCSIAQIDKWIRDGAPNN
jgi:hypothetical protein